MGEHIILWCLELRMHVDSGITDYDTIGVRAVLNVVSWVGHSTDIWME